MMQQHRDSFALPEAFIQAHYFAPLEAFGMLVVGGKDALPFLQGQLTLDMRCIHHNTARLGAYCTIQGRMIANFLVWQQGAEYGLVMSRDLIDNTKKILQKHTLRHQVTLTCQSDEYMFIGLSESVALTTFQLSKQTSKTYQTIQQNACFATRLPNHTWIVGIPRHIKQAFLATLDTIAPSIDAMYWQLAQIRSGIAWLCHETAEAFLPQMASMDLWEAVSFNKGCYKGQEVVARARYLGQVKRHLYHIQSDMPLAVGEILSHPAHPAEAIGQIVQICPINQTTYEALAVMKDAVWGEQTCLNLAQGTIQPIQRFAAKL
ncbi:MAG: folate-binding protein YgfZ [Neisseriales bacterium]|nr:MAG: folate-binding protein YgfZ [Neisseriales bacterium]